MKNEQIRAQGASAEAIQEHYDTSNDFYSLWLDPSMTYSCALWEEGDSLETAQQRKIDFHLAQCGASDAERLLEIGCGWGSTLTRAVQTHGVKSAVGLTLSAEQHSYVRALDLPGVEVKLESWADHAPAVPYDAIVSVGALEHFVRPELEPAERVAVYRAFFERCHELLRPGKRMSLQTISYGIGAFRVSAFSKIFPESDCPRLIELVEASQGLFEIRALRNDREHYARTVREWLDRLRSHRASAEAMVGAQRVLEYEEFLAAVITGMSAPVFGLLRMQLQRIDPRRRG